jgi:hypothetical protein
MGGMNTWLWGNLYSEMAKALRPIACHPRRITGVNLLFRCLMIAIIQGGCGRLRESETAECSRCRTGMESFSVVSAGCRSRSRRRENRRCGKGCIIRICPFQNPLLQIEIRSCEVDDEGRTFIVHFCKQKNWGETTAGAHPRIADIEPYRTALSVTLRTLYELLMPHLTQAD